MASVKLDLSVRFSPQLPDGWIDRCRHNLRVGWRAFQLKKWCGDELLEIPSPPSWFRKIDWGDARNRATTSPAAATLCLGAWVLLQWSFPSHLLGVCVLPSLRSSVFPPPCFGWAAGEDSQTVQSVRGWLSFVQSQLWKVQYG